MTTVELSTYSSVLPHEQQQQVRYQRHLQKNALLKEGTEFQCSVYQQKADLLNLVLSEKEMPVLWELSFSIALCGNK